MKLTEYLKSIKSMSDKKANEIASFYKQEHFTKETLLIKEGKTSHKSYFLESGIVRCYIIDFHGNEITTRFFSSGDFFNDFLSFFEQKPSQENFELITESTVYSIDYNNAQYCFHHIPEFREWGRLMLTLNYAFVNHRMLSLYKNTAQERYLTLLKEHPEIIKTVPLNMIASYLGITKFSLSRIRKEIE